MFTRILHIPRETNDAVNGFQCFHKSSYSKTKKRPEPLVVYKNCRYCFLQLHNSYYFIPWL